MDSFAMPSDVGRERKFAHLYDLADGPTAVHKEPASKKRSVSSPVRILSETVTPQSGYVRQFPEANGFAVLGKPTTLSPFSAERKLFESTVTPSSGGRTPPLGNHASTASSSVPEPSGPSKTVDKSHVQEEVRIHESTVTPTVKIGSHHKISHFEKLTPKTEKKDRIVPEKTAFGALSGISLCNHRMNSLPEESNSLSIIPEDNIPVVPTVVTVELAAAAKIFLETYYDEILRGPTPRALRIHHLKSQLYIAKELSAAGKQYYLDAFCRAGTDHLRKLRVLKASSARSRLFDKGSRSTKPRATTCAAGFEVLKTLGKGSFGTVRLVREKASSCDDITTAREKKKQVYAMKVIRKSEMIRSGQEGHMRAERDFLVSSEGSNWTVPLVASFQDATNLYLVMEYMPGGDFLGLLIRENVLDEAVARFYIAEMILAVEEAHALQFIHRDIKPDNFLISASGHLKISDFGLAFDGHWSHESRYYSSTRYSLLQTLGIFVAGDEQDQKKDEKYGVPGAMVCSSSMMAGLEKHQRPPEVAGKEPILQWRNRCGNQIAAKSVWSIGVIFYECLYGRTPFLSEQGRSKTKENILNHESVFAFPTWPPVSRRGQQILAALVTDKSRRLCSKRYQLKDAAIEELAKITDSGRVLGKDSFCLAAGHGMARQYVFPFDAEDIKAHKFFKGLPWERLSQMPPPFIPKIRSDDDTRYFEDSAIFDDDDDDESTDPPRWSDRDNDKGNHVKKGVDITDKPLEVATMCKEEILAAKAEKGGKRGLIDKALKAFDAAVQMKALSWIATPCDSQRLKAIETEIEQLIALGLSTADGEALLHFVERFGKREKKRPRDRLLRDQKTKKIAMELRKRNAFLGYTWRRMGSYKAMIKQERGAEASLALMRSSNRGCLNR
ncbi:hypothetical protein SEPCBS119000_004600 [Sporothrix epigloea]|uniref:non-specific serine/threonine protein kinase n=1 Tax=Sporothrix epigloea TaxID=1892477 RepID=A0ABP0DWZ3_9PEZI